MNATLHKTHISEMQKAGYFLVILPFKTFFILSAGIYGMNEIHINQRSNQG